MNSNNSSINQTQTIKIKSETKGIQRIEKLYENMTYFSEYGFSVFLFIFITLLILLGCGFCYVMLKAESIRADWVNQRCNPYVIPFAGFINKPDDMTISEYTQQNFDFCNQTILKSGAGEALEPLTYITNVLVNVASAIEEAIQNIRAMFNKVRTNIQNVITEIMGRLLNIMAPLQVIMISFRDIIAKMEGIMTASLYTSIGSYYTFQSLMGAIVNLIIQILIALAATIISLWIIPVTWPAAASMSAIFISISIPLALIVAFITDVLHIKPDNPIPDLPPQPQCFDENTMLEMDDGTFKSIKKMNVGDLLKNKNRVTAKLKLKRTTAKMYDLHGVIVSDSHIVYSKILNDWVYISHHPNAKLLDSYGQAYLYCLNTSQKRIEINGMTFLDWDEILRKDDEEKLSKEMKKIDNEFLSKDLNENIHKYLDGGFIGTTEIKLKNGEKKEIRNIEIGDILEKGEKVTGLVEIDGTTLSDQYIYKNETFVFEGGHNIIIHKKDGVYSTLNLDKNNKDLIEKQKREKKEEKLYHLITDKLTFSVGDLSFYSYNSCIDFFLEK